jgi:hypothetical protein
LALVAIHQSPFGHEKLKESGYQLPATRLVAWTDKMCFDPSALTDYHRPKDCLWEHYQRDFHHRWQDHNQALDWLADPI